MPSEGRDHRDHFGGEICIYSYPTFYTLSHTVLLSLGSIDIFEENIELPANTSVSIESSF